MMRSCFAKGGGVSGKTYFQVGVLCQEASKSALSSAFRPAR